MAITSVRVGGRRRGWPMTTAALAFGSYGLWVIKNPVFLSAIAAYGTAFAVLVGVRLYIRPLDHGGRLLIGGHHRG